MSAAPRGAERIVIREDPPTALAEYGRVPIAFEVRERLSLTAPDGGLGGLHLAVEPVTPYVKDYDAHGAPTRWLARFDVARWGFLAAWADDARVGGAVVVWDTPGVDMLERRADLAVLWDLRVAPSHRGRGVGAALFRAAEAWARSRGAWWLKIETQNVNVGACRFYARQGCALGAIHRFAYPELPDEVQLLWYKPIRG